MKYTQKSIAGCITNPPYDYEFISKTGMYPKSEGEFGEFKIFQLSKYLIWTWACRGEYEMFMLLVIAQVQVAMKNVGFYARGIDRFAPAKRNSKRTESSEKLEEMGYDNAEQ